MRPLALVLVALSCIVMTACGGGGGGGPTGTNGNNNGNNTVSGDGNITMTVNGGSWRSLKAIDHVTKGTSNFIGISSGNPPYTLILGIGSVTGPGTRNLNLTVGDGSSAIVSTTTGGWGTAFTGGSGTVTITTFTANRIAGTFSFDAMPGSGAASGTLQVRNGAFDLTY
jgi:hypothetical protein